MTRPLLATVIAVALITGPASASQSSVKPSEVMAFIGTWVFAMTNPHGAQETVRIWDNNGAVSASVRSGSSPPIEASGILYDGDMLVLTVKRFENGKPIRAVIALRLDGDTMHIAQMLEFSETIKRGSGKKHQRGPA